MQAARRLYLYVMSGITGSVVAGGLVILLRVLLRDAFPESFASDFDNTPQQLSQAIAMLGVGSPVWAIHWWLAQRGARPGRPGADAERGSALRAAYFALTLLVSLTAWFAAALSLGRWLVDELAGTSAGYHDPLGNLTVGAVAFGVWLYHGIARRRDMAAGPVAGAAAWLPRLYVHGVAVVALFVAVGSAVSVLSEVLLPLDPSYQGSIDAGFVLERLGSAAAWGALWLGHWLYAGRLLLDPGWRGPEEQAAKVRVAAFFVVIIGAATLALTEAAGAIQSAIVPLLPGRDYWIWMYVVTSALGSVVYALIWWWHDRAFRREPAAAEPLRALHQERLTSYGLSAVALAIGAVAVGWLAGIVLDLLLGGRRSAGGELQYLGYEIGNWVSLAAVAVPAWVLSWRGVLARRRADPLDEAGSTIRRTFLFLVLGAALLVVLSTATLILYRLVGLLLDAGIGGNVVSELSTPAGALLAALVVAAYHGLALRGDQRMAAEARDAAAAPGEGVPASPDAPVPADEAGLDLRLVGSPGSGIEAALAAARAALPEGFQLLNRP